MTLLSSIGASTTQGLANVQKHEQGRELRDVRLAEAKTRQEMSSMQLASAQATQPDRTQLELQSLQNQLHSANSQSVLNDTVSGIKRYNADGDTRHLNTWLQNVKKNSVGQTLFSSVMRVDQLTKSAETDRLLRAQGITDVDAVYTDPMMSKELVLVTSPDGKQAVQDMATLYAGTGYAKYATNEELAEAEKRARISNLLRKGGSMSRIQQQEQAVQSLLDSGKYSTYAEAYQAVLNMGKGSRMGSDEALIREIAEENGVSMEEAITIYYEQKNKGKGRQATDTQRAMDYLRADPANAGKTDAELYSMAKNMGKTAPQKEMADINAAKDTLNELNFFDTNVADLSMTEQDKLYRHIQTIEDLRNIKLSTKERDNLADINEVIAMGGKAANQLTPEETGILDSTLSSLKAYMFDEVGGKEGVAAYETLRNSIRRAMSGLAVSETENKNFENAAGTLKKKFAPAMTQMKVQLEAIKSRLQTVANTNDPHLAHWYTGVSSRKLKQIIRGIDERLGIIQKQIPAEARPQAGRAIFSTSEKVKASSVVAPVEEDSVNKPGLDRKAMDEIFGGLQQ